MFLWHTSMSAVPPSATKCFMQPVLGLVQSVFWGCIWLLQLSLHLIMSALCCFWQQHNVVVKSYFSHLGIKKMEWFSHSRRGNGPSAFIPRSWKEWNFRKHYNSLEWSWGEIKVLILQHWCAATDSLHDRHSSFQLCSKFPAASFANCFSCWMFVALQVQWWGIPSGLSILFSLLCFASFGRGGRGAHKKATPVRNIFPLVWERCFIFWWSKAFWSHKKQPENFTPRGRQKLPKPQKLDIVFFI